jgi:hypothetical protein
MNSSSVLVKIAGNSSSPAGTTTKGCLTPPSSADVGGSVGQTYFAGAIYAAQTALQAEKPVADGLIQSVPGMSLVTSTNMIIFVSDGQANTDATKFPSNPSTATAQSISGLSAGVGGINVAYGGTTVYSPLSTSENLAGVAGSWGKYPDSNNACQQAMMAAQYAASQKTVVIGVAYGSETNGCLVGDSPYAGVDNTNAAALTLSGTFNVAITNPTTIVPCVTVENIADSWSDFFAESASVGCNTSLLKYPMGSLASIFSNGILGRLGPTPKLIPNTIN